MDEIYKTYKARGCNLALLIAEKPAEAHHLPVGIPPNEIQTEVDNIFQWMRWYLPGEVFFGLKKKFANHPYYP